MSYDAIIIGGGHNGLVCAAYLARAGKRVLVLERNEIIGGAARSEEVFPGFRFSVFSYVVSLLRPEIIRELEPGKSYVDSETGEAFEVVGKLTPLAPSESDLPYAVENLRLCGCSLEQLVQKDLNDCPHCGRRMAALER